MVLQLVSESYKVLKLRKAAEAIRLKSIGTSGGASLHEVRGKMVFGGRAGHALLDTMLLVKSFCDQFPRNYVTKKQNLVMAYLHPNFLRICITKFSKKWDGVALPLIGV